MISIEKVERRMKTELPTEISIPCSIDAANHAVERDTKRHHSRRKPVPLVSAHSCISMRYDPSKPGGVTVVDPRSASSHDEFDRTDATGNISKKHNGEEIHSVEHASDENEEDDMSSTGAKSPKRKTKATSRRKPLPLVYARSSISMRLAPSRPDRVLVVNPASPSYKNDKATTSSPRADQAGSISSVAPFKGYPVEVDNESLNQEDEEDATSTKAVSRRKVKKSSQRRPLPLVTRNSSTSMRSAPPVSSQAAIVERDECLISPKSISSASMRGNRVVSPRSGQTDCKSTVGVFHGNSAKINDESQIKHACDDADKKNEPPSRSSNQSHHNTVQYDKNDQVSGSAASTLKVEVISPVPQDEDKGVVVSTRSSIPASQTGLLSPRDHGDGGECLVQSTRSDKTKSLRIRPFNNETMESRDDDDDDDCMRPPHYDFNRQLTWRCDESLSRIRTIKSDFEVEIRTSRRYDETEEDEFDYYSVTTPNTAPTASMCSSSSSTSCSHDPKKKGFLRRMLPMKIKNKLARHTAGARSVLSAPERKLPELSEMVTRQDHYNANRSTRSIITVNPNVLEHVTSELTDAESTILSNLSEEQRKSAGPTDDTAKEISAKAESSRSLEGKISIGNAMQTTRNEADSLLSKIQEDDENAAKAGDQKSDFSGKYLLNNDRTVGHMLLSPVISDLSGTVSEPLSPLQSFEEKYSNNLKPISEVSSIASPSNKLSRVTEIKGDSSVGSQRPCCNTSTRSLSRKISADMSTEKDDTITTIYDRNALARYSLSRPTYCPQTLEKGSNVPEIRLDPSGGENLEQQVKSPETIDSSPFAGYFPSPRFPTLHSIKAPFGLSFGAEDGHSVSGLDRYRSERSRKAELAMLPSDDDDDDNDSDTLDDPLPELPEPSPDYLKQKLDESDANPFFATLNALRAQFGL